MRYTKGTTLVGLAPAELHRLARVPVGSLLARGLVVFDNSASDFFFEFEPAEDVDTFLRHSYFAEMRRGQLIASNESLFEVGDVDRGAPPDECIVVQRGNELPAPLRKVAVDAAFDVIESGAEYRGIVTLCDCGVGACFSQYAWVRQQSCIALFTVDAFLREVAWRPFRINVRRSGAAQV